MITVFTVIILQRRFRLERCVLVAQAILVKEIHKILLMKSKFCIQYYKNYALQERAQIYADK